MEESIIDHREERKIRQNKLVQEKYANGMSMRDACKEVGISTGTFYKRRHKALGKQVGGNKNISPKVTNEQSNDNKRPLEEDFDPEQIERLLNTYENKLKRDRKSGNAPAKVVPKQNLQPVKRNSRR